MGGKCSDKCHSISQFIYNPSKNAFLGRTCSSWVLIILYFTIYYMLLAGFFMAMISVLMYGLLDDSKPHLTGLQSLLRLNPGLGFLPRPDVDKPMTDAGNIHRSSLNWYFNATETFLEEYDLDSDCYNAANQGGDFDPSAVCRFPKSELGPCADPRKAYMDDKSLCLYVKLNRIYGWLPDVNGTEVTIECVLPNSQRTEMSKEPTMFPKSKINASLGAISTSFFPFLNQNGYQSPLVAIMFEGDSHNYTAAAQCLVSGIGDGENFFYDLSIEAEQS